MASQPPLHVWVDTSGTWSSPIPGLLLAWRRMAPSPGREPVWEGWVVRATAPPAQPQYFHMSQDWIPAVHIRPARSARP